MTLKILFFSITFFFYLNVIGQNIYFNKLKTSIIISNYGEKPKLKELSDKAGRYKFEFHNDETNTVIVYNEEETDFYKTWNWYTKIKDDGYEELNNKLYKKVLRRCLENMAKELFLVATDSSKIIIFKEGDIILEYYN